MQKALGAHGLALSPVGHPNLELHLLSRLDEAIAIALVVGHPPGESKSRTGQALRGDTGFQISGCLAAFSEKLKAQIVGPTPCPLGHLDGHLPGFALSWIHATEKKLAIVVKSMFTTALGPQTEKGCLAGILDSQLHRHLAVGFGLPLGTHTLANQRELSLAQGTVSGSQGPIHFQLLELLGHLRQLGLLHLVQEIRAFVHHRRSARRLDGQQIVSRQADLKILLETLIGQGQFVVFFFLFLRHIKNITHSFRRL